MINPTDNDESDDNNRSDESAIIGEVQTHEAIRKVYKKISIAMLNASDKKC